VLVDGPQGSLLSPARLLDAIEPACRLAPESPHVALGRFERDGRAVLLAVNVGQQPYRGQLSVGGAGTWISLDPATGAVQPLGAPDAGRLPLTLAARQAILLVRGR
jgi:hypothetical protein